MSVTQGIGVRLWTVSSNNMMKIFANKLFLVFAIFSVVLATVVIVYFSAHTTCCTEELNEKQIVQISNDAEKGNIASMKRLFFFFDERHMNGDPEKADYWLKRAADAGDGQAEIFMYEKLIASNNLEIRTQALNYLKNAADHGDSTAQEILEKSKEPTSNTSR